MTADLINNNEIYLGQTLQPYCSINSTYIYILYNKIKITKIIIGKSIASHHNKEI